MSNPNRQGEALYIIILRDPQAQHLLKTWASKNKQDVHVSNNRMSLYSQHSLNQFQVTWTNSWTNITVWDSWNKRHVYLD